MSSLLSLIVSFIKPILRILLNSILAIIITVSFLTGLLAIAITLPYRTFVLLLAKLLKPNLVNFVSGLSCLFSVDDLRNPRASLVNFCVLDGEIPLSKFKQLCSERVLELKNPKTSSYIYSKLRQSWTSFGGYTFWKWDPDFSIDNHVRAYDYKEEHLRLGETSDEDDLRRIMAGLNTVPWKPNRSPWEFLLIFNYKPTPDSKPQMVFVIRRHHILGDGYSSLGVIRHLFQAELPLAMPSVKEVPLWLKVLSPIVLPFKVPYDFAANLIDSVDFGNDWHKTTEYADYEASFTGRISVAKVKEIKTKYKVSFMAVIFSAACGGIKRIMEEAGQTVPKSLGCVIPVPKPKHPGGLCNHMFLVFTKWPIKIESPSERLRKIQDNINDLQFSTAPIALDMILGACGMMPAFFINFIGSFMSCTLVSTIFPGTLKPVFFEGLEVTDHFSGGGTLRSPIGASIVVVGAYENQRIVINIHKKVFPQQEIFRKLGPYIEDELERLLRLGR
ncbi:unnamed protein product [Allacma fusca]|uniref:O-acyltransferase WSD1 C-terminal domain-containing protein n=1 Tax=Allacma fusca TaxID=39272 RepID=A0A8J2K7K5_9HEXA|nr:unnamed protein product [Allacma fusca]